MIRVRLFGRGKIEICTNVQHHVYYFIRFLLIQKLNRFKEDFTPTSKVLRSIFRDDEGGKFSLFPSDNVR